ncbi:hypothetical protein AOQ84DRAFT_220306 [Glonium stellatum]|uniref:Uncharacterized protein n=1 Tax=Glonium stellatum TaxID=574774 RepID=A0A8E2JUN0_9PEZI|nr:hypothetical protein AOQ84DRAFT_220306 [Glonium stellatum]
MHVPTSSITTPAITTITTTASPPAATTIIAAAEYPLPHKDTRGSFWNLFISIVDSVIATYIVDGRAAKAATLCYLLILVLLEGLRMRIRGQITALRQKLEGYIRYYGRDWRRAEVVEDFSPPRGRLRMTRSGAWTLQPPASSGFPGVGSRS